MGGSPATLLLTRGDVAALLHLDECIDAVERAFRAHGEGRALGPLRAALATSDLCVTCTPSRAAFLRRDDVAPGTFVAAVGADDADKHEVEPALLAVSTIVVDSREQCARIGDLHHALAVGVVTPEAVHAELGEVVAGRRPGRRAPDEIVIFDSTGTALQDVAAAAAVYEKAVRAGRGAAVSLGA